MGWQWGEHDICHGGVHGDFYGDLIGRIVVKLFHLKEAEAKADLATAKKELATEKVHAKTEKVEEKKKGHDDEHKPDHGHQALPHFDFGFGDFGQHEQFNAHGFGHQQPQQHKPQEHKEDEGKKDNNRGLFGLRGLFSRNRGSSSGGGLFGAASNSQPQHQSPPAGQGQQGPRLGNLLLNSMSNLLGGLSLSPPADDDLLSLSGPNLASLLPDSYGPENLGLIK